MIEGEICNNEESEEEDSSGLVLDCRGISSSLNSSEYNDESRIEGHLNESGLSTSNLLAASQAFYPQERNSSVI